MTSMAEMMKEYADYLKTDKTETTMQGYMRTLRLYTDYIGVDRFTTKDILAWRSYLTEKGNSITTISLYMQHIKLFCAFVGGLDASFEMPNFKLILPDGKKVAREKKKEYSHVLTSEEVLEILSAERPLTFRKEVWTRNKAILSVFLTGSMRNTELCNIKVADLDFENGQILLEVTKGGKPRFARFGKVSQSAVSAWLAERKEWDAIDQSPYLFVIPSTDGKEAPKQFERSGMSTLVERLVRAIVGEENVRSHALRHASASFMLNAGEPIDIIQHRLGHENISNTMIYAKRLQGGMGNGEDAFDKAVGI